MSLSILTDPTALATQSTVNQNRGSLAKMSEQMSTGSSLNRAADGPARMAISGQMTLQIEGLEQGRMNANDAINLAQTADGALTEVTKNLNFIRVLSNAALNGTNSKTSLQADQTEIVQRLAEINRTSAQTSFSGNKVFDGSIGAMNFQIGAEDGETIEILLQKMNTETLALKGFDVTQTMTVKVNSGDQVKGSIEKANITNSGNGIATAATDLVKDSTGAYFAKNSDGLYAVTQAGPTDAATFNHSAKFVDATDTVTGANKVTPTNFLKIGDSYYALLTGSDTNDYYAATVDYVTGKASFTSNDTAQVTAFNDAGTASPVTATALFIDKNGAYYVSANASAGPFYAATINNIDEAEFNSDDGEATGVTLEDLNKIARAGTVYVNTEAAATGTAIAAGDIMVRASDTPTGATTSVNAMEVDTTFDGSALTAGESLYRYRDTVTGETKFVVGTPVSATGTPAVLKDATVNGAGVSAAGTATTKAFNLAPLETLSAAVDMVSALRSTLGAIQNRLSSTIISQDTSITNLSAARSSIRDADMAAVATSFAQFQVLLKAAIEMLVQINQQKELILSLVRGR